MRKEYCGGKQWAACRRPCREIQCDYHVHITAQCLFCCHFTPYLKWREVMCVYEKHTEYSNVFLTVSIGVTT